MRQITERQGVQLRSDGPHLLRNDWSGGHFDVLGAIFIAVVLGLLVAAFSGAGKAEL